MTDGDIIFRYFQGVIDTLIMPFIFTCVICSLCGCFLCLGCPKEISKEMKTAFVDTIKNTDLEAMETMTANGENEHRRSEPAEDKDDTQHPKLRKCWTAFEWILWVVCPFVATLYITVSLYKHDAVRTANDDLFKSGLAVFITALLNLMVYFQQFMKSICSYGQKKVSEK